MASYSKVFKASQVSMMSDVKLITNAPTSFNKHEDEETESESPNLLEEEGIAQASQLLEEAEKQAIEILERAEQKARVLEAETSENITNWWKENEEKLEVMTQDAVERGYQDGFEQGKAEAESKVHQEYEATLKQVQELLQQGYEQKQVIIAEAEPFLLEMSTVIAEKILKQELENAPEKFVELIQQHILRFKEKDSIIVCVHPDDFNFIQSQRNHLVSVVNGETEIKIIPDHSVSPMGCVIRTAYGSVDARIDTQIEEIKKAILDARREPEIVAIN